MLPVPSEEASPAQPFIAHLVELRTRLIRTVAVILLVFVCLFPWSANLYHGLARPLLQALPSGGQLIATEVAGGFLVPLKLTGMVAFLLTLPHTLYQIWAFVAPGLYQHEKRLVLPLLCMSLLLFALGMSFAYFVVFPLVFHFFVSALPDGVAMMTDIGKYLDFVYNLFLSFGLAFETPVVVILLVRIGVLRLDQLKAARPYVLIAAFVVAAIVTPPDVLSQVLLAVPLCLLYELGLFLARWVRPKPRAE